MYFCFKKPVQLSLHVLYDRDRGGGCCTWRCRAEREGEEVKGGRKRQTGHARESEGGGRENAVQETAAPVQ